MVYNSESYNIYRKLKKAFNRSNGKVEKVNAIAETWEIASIPYIIESTDFAHDPT